MTEISGKIIKALSGFYYVLVEDDIITCRARGNFRNDKISPLVGDFVKIKIEEDSIGYVVEIFDRENELLRPRVANIDYNIIVTSLVSPNYSSKLLDKLIALNEYSGVKSIIIFTKLDLVDEKLDVDVIKKYYCEIGYIVFTNSDDDIEQLKMLLDKKFVSISGQSGSGKSTLINRLSNHRLSIETNIISKHLGRGKHTTRHIEFHKINNFYIADTPGFSSLDITFIEKEDLKYLFKEFNHFECKFSTCNHIDEPSCRVKENLGNDSYFDERYENYKLLYKEKEQVKRRY